MITVTIFELITHVALNFMPDKDKNGDSGLMITYYGYVTVSNAITLPHHINLQT